MISINWRGRGGIRTHEGLAPLAVFKTAALNHSATLPCQCSQGLTAEPSRTKRGFCYRVATILAERRIDRGCGLAVVVAEQMRVDAQCNVWLGVSQALADGDDIDTRVDEL
jgi:hypothetical protein